MSKKPSKPVPGPLKNDKPFLLCRQPISRADLQFYEGYDPGFLAKKATVLFAAYKHPEAFASFMHSIRQPLEATDASFFGALATELHCTAFHQYEGLLALLLAEYQNRPDWVYLSSYSTKEIKQGARALADGRFEEITHGANRAPEEFVVTAVYATAEPKDASTNEAWNKSLTDIAWFVARCAEEYLRGREYNAYKHGLRVVSGSAGFAVKMGVASDFKTILSMLHSLSYLELEEVEDGYVGKEVTLEINPESSYEHIQIAAGILSITREMRIARGRGHGDSLTLLDMDRNKLSSLKPISRMTHSY